MSNIEYRTVIKFSTWKGLHATEIIKELDNVYNDDVLSYQTVAKCLTPSKHPQRAFEDSSRKGPTSTITTYQNIQVVERITIRDQQVSVRHIFYELPIPTTTIYEIMSNDLGMKKISIRWVPKLLTPIQRTVVQSFCKRTK